MNKEQRMKKEIAELGRAIYSHYIPRGSEDVRGEEFYSEGFVIPPTEPLGIGSMRTQDITRLLWELGYG